MKKINEMGVKGVGIDSNFFDIKNAMSTKDLKKIERKVAHYDKTKIKVAFKEWLEDRKLDIESIGDINVDAIKSMRDLFNAQKKKLMKRESVMDRITLYLNEEKQEAHVCKECGGEWKGTAEQWKKWKGPCPECDKPKSQFN